MRRKCPTCGEQELVRQSARLLRLGVPWLNNLAQVETSHACPSCGSEVTTVIQQFENMSPESPLDRRGDSDTVNQRHLSWRGVPGPFISLPGVVREGDRVFIPTFEGSIQEGGSIDRFGEPDLMAEMAEEYLRQFWVLMPKGRFPSSLKEVMPALLLLFVSAELALKAFLIRSGRPTPGHDLSMLHEGLDKPQQAEVERSFRESQVVGALLQHENEAPNIKAVLARYSSTYDTVGGVYGDVRYFAEPTTMLPKSSNLHGRNVIKGTLYPVFMPEIVRALLETYESTSGPSRLRRRGGNAEKGVRDQGVGSHGDWSLVPASLGLVVMAVPQAVALGPSGEETAAFRDFVGRHPPALQADWMYGGSRLLFYRDDQGSWLDQETLVDGMECHVWRSRRLGMHSRDLDRLADALDEADKGTKVLGDWTKAPVRRQRER